MPRRQCSHDRCLLACLLAVCVPAQCRPSLPLLGSGPDLPVPSPLVLCEGRRYSARWSSVGRTWGPHGGGEVVPYGRCLGILPRTLRSWHEGISFVSTHRDCRMDVCGTRRRRRRARELITQARAWVHSSAGSLVCCSHPGVKPRDWGWSAVKVSHHGHDDDLELSWEGILSRHRISYYFPPSSPWHTTVR